MITLDTNVLVRAITDDDPLQSPLARQVLSELSAASPGFVTHAVLLELYWVLARSKGLPVQRVLAAYELLMSMEALEIEDGESVGEALEQARQGADFGDALIEATSRLYGVAETVTFDRDAARRFGWRLLG